MSGHSKWATIKHKKGAADAKRGKLFTKLIKEITVAARMGGGDLESNPRLRTALLKAKTANMPKSNIDRAVKKGVGELGAVDFVELQYEAYAQGGVALLIEALTDNKNRTAAEVRSVLSKGGGQLAAAGSVAFQFKRKGIIRFDRQKVNFDALFELALEGGAEEVLDEGEIVEIQTDPADFEGVLASLQEKGFDEVLEAEVSMVADNSHRLEGEKARKALRMIEALEDCSDVQGVYSNLDLPDDFSLE